ncbi:MAG: AAA family ATPase [Helicobacteraceae bacterium]|nr:AAA family ATPase [Helicobacteraceae bacterium]
MSVNTWKHLRTWRYVIAIAHKKGGSGKTTVACNLAAELSKEFKTTIIDADSQQHLTKFNNRRETPINLVECKSADELVKFLKSDDGLVVIDLGGYDSDLSRAILTYADLVITPMSNTANDQEGLAEFLPIMKQVKDIRSDIESYILINRVHFADKGTLKFLKGFCEKSDIFNVFNTVIPSRKQHEQILATGKSVVESEPFSKASLEIQELVKEIKEKVGSNG